MQPDKQPRHEVQHASRQGVSDYGRAVPCASRRLTPAHAPAGSKLAAGPRQEPPAGLLSRFGPAEQGPSRHPRRCALVATFITDSPVMLSRDLWGGGRLTLCKHSFAKGRCGGDKADEARLQLKSHVTLPACRHSQHECSMGEDRGSRQAGSAGQDGALIGKRSRFD